MNAHAIDALFDQLLDQKGSDLHLAIGYPPLGRVRGELVSLREAVVDAAEMESWLFEIVNPDQKRQIVEELDLDFAYAHPRARFILRRTCSPSIQSAAITLGFLQDRTLRSPPARTMLSLFA